MIAIESGDVDVVAAVVIVIGYGYAQTIYLDIEAAPSADICEGAVVVIAIEGRVRLAAPCHPVFAVDQKDVRPAVAVRVEEGAACAHGFRKPLLSGSSGVVGELDAGGLSDVGEVNVVGECEIGRA